MKAAETTTRATPARNHAPFFHHEGGQHFFGKNTKVASFFHKPSSIPLLQTKLTIGQPNDPYEKEADAVADQVVQRLSESDTLQAKPVGLAHTVTPLIQTKCAACEEEEKLQKKEEDGELLEDKVQRKPIFESNAEPPDDAIQRKCAACEKESLLQKKGSNHTAQAAPSSIESSLTSAKGSGSPLPEGTRQQMESSFGTDFSQVRIHSDSAAVQMNKDLHAQAFTHGSDIYFNEGKYNPQTSSGKHLLAHELTHTLQQGASVNRTIQRTTHGRGGPLFTPTNCNNPLIPLNARMAGIAAHAQIAATLSFLGIHPQAIPRATKRRMGSPAPFGTNLGFADLWTIAGSMVHISEIKPTNIGHGRARREARHYADRHNEWNLRFPSIFPDDLGYDALINLEGGAHPIAGDVLDLSGFTGTGLAIGPFAADLLKLLFIEGDSQGALVYWCQGPGIMNPLLVLLLKKALDALKKMLENAKRVLDDFIDSLPSPGAVADAIAKALVVLLLLAALVCMIIAVLCIMGIVTAPCAALGIAGAAAATAAALLLLGINIPGFTDGTDPIAATSNTDFTQPSETPPAERELRESTIFAMATSIFTLPDPVSLAQSLSPTISIEQAKLAIQGISNTLEAAGEVKDAAYIRNQLNRIESAKA